MSIRERLEADLKQAMKSRDSARLSCLRMVKSKMQEYEVSRRAKQGRDYQIDDEAAFEVISSYAKQRRDSIEGYLKGGRDELAAAEQAELAIVAEYLPEQLTEDAIAEIVRQAIAESGASGAGDMGAVMRIVMPAVRGRADGKQVQQVVRSLLA
jgi:uncharacterized protein YqeY